MKKSELRKYLNCVKKELICSSSIKQNYIRELKSQINDFAEQKGDLTLDMLYTEFGSPKEIADIFWSKEDLESLNKKAKKYETLKWIVLSLLITLVLSIIITTIVIITDEEYNTTTYAKYIERFLL